VARTRGLSEAEIQARWDRVVELTFRGVSAAEIAHQLGITERTVFRIRRQRMVARCTPLRFTDDEIASAEQMLADGASIAEVARSLGRSPNTVNKRFRGRGWSKVQCAEFGALRWKALRLLGPEI
jgi:DNA-binding CsgD family transcriptional regulator